MRQLERLIRLEEYRGLGCATCRAWAPATITVTRLDASGREEGTEPSRPERCPDCGRQVPIQLERHLVIVRGDAVAHGEKR